jgi:membrane protease YdiL (CAAX protease family)
MQIQTFLWQRNPLSSAPWKTKELWVGFGLALLIYSIGSFIGAFIIKTYHWQNSPLLGVILAPIQLGMSLPPLLIMSRYGKPITIMGLNRFDLLMLLETAIALGFGFCGMIIWGLFLLRFGIQAQEPIVPLFGDGKEALISVFVVGAILAPMIEELVFRGFLFAGLRKQYRLSTATIVSGAIFGAIHLQPFAFPPLFLLGVILALLYERTGSLWAPILMHFCVNALALIAQYIAHSQGLI